MSAEFTLRLRVYFEDTDAGGVVYHANYLKFMERCRSDWLRQLGFGQHELQQQGAQFVVRRLLVDYHQPAKLDDELDVSLQQVKLGRASISFQQHISCGETLLCTADVKVACISAVSLKPRAIPALIAQRFGHG